MEPWSALVARNGATEGRGRSKWTRRGSKWSHGGPLALVMETWMVKMEPWRAVDARNGLVEGQNGAMEGRWHS